MRYPARLIVFIIFCLIWSQPLLTQARSLCPLLVQVNETAHQMKQQINNQPAYLESGAASALPDGQAEHDGHDGHGAASGADLNAGADLAPCAMQFCSQAPSTLSSPRQELDAPAAELARLVPQGEEPCSLPSFNSLFRPPRLTAL